MTSIMLSAASRPTLAKNARMGHPRSDMGKKEKTADEGGPPAKCNPTVAAAIAAAVLLGQKIAEALAQFCAETEVCALAKNDPYRFPEDKQLPVYFAHAGGELGHGKAFGHAVTSLNR